MLEETLKVKYINKIKIITLMFVSTDMNESMFFFTSVIFYKTSREGSKTYI